MGINFGGAFIQTSQTPTYPLFPSEELVQLALQGGLNRLNTFAPLVIPHIMAAQAQLKSGDDTILRVLQNMRSIVYGGMTMLPIFENWGFENKLPLMVIHSVMIISNIAEFLRRTRWGLPRQVRNIQFGPTNILRPGRPIVA